MNDVFISYAREDRQRAADLASLLERNDISVWWDWNLIGGSKYRDVIASKLRESAKVVVLWSASSVASSFVIDEAQEAKDAGKLIPIAIDGVRPPFGFRDLHTITLDENGTELPALLAAINEEPIRSPATSTPPSPRAKRSYGRIAAIGLGALAALASVAILAVVLLSNPRSAEIEPVFSTFMTSDLGLTIVYPSNILSVDTTEENQRRIRLRDENGDPVVLFSRTSLPDHADVKIGRYKEAADLRGRQFVVTYEAPQRERNWSNWYSLSGLYRGSVFYFKRWYTQDSVVSIEFEYPKSSQPLYEELIPKMTREFGFTGITPIGLE